MSGILWPNGSTTRPPVTSGFGPRKAPVPGASTFHRGTDFVGFSAVRAIADGKVVAVGTPTGWGGGGTQVWVQHDGFLTRSMHLASTAVRVGQNITAGQTLGVMGRTGNVSGVHLHLEIVVHGIQVDPVPFISNRIATSGGGSSEEDDMTPEQDARLRNIENLLAGGGPSLTDPSYAAAPGTVLQHLQNLTGFVYAGGPSTRDPEYLGGEGTLYALAKTPVYRGDMQVPQLQELADAKTIGMRTEQKLDQLLGRPAAVVSDAQVKAIADAVAAQIGKPSVAIDYAAIAKAVNDDAARRMGS